MNDDEREPDSFAPRLRPPGPLHRGSDAFQLDTPESDVESNRAGWPGLDQLDVLSRRRQIDRLSRGSAMSLPDPSRTIGRPISSRQEGRADANFADLFMPRAAQAVLWLL